MPRSHLQDTVPEVQEQEQAGPSSGSPTRSPRLGSFPVPRRSMAAPSGRSGPPRSISYNYSLSGGSHPPSRTNSHDIHEENGRNFLFLTLPERVFEDPDQPEDFPPVTTPFRGALEYSDPDQREKEKEAAERKGKRRERDSYFHDVFNPSRWLPDSPKLEHPTVQIQPEHPAIQVQSENEDQPEARRPHKEQEVQEEERIAKIRVPGRQGRSPTMQSPVASSPSSRFAPFRRTKSLPHFDSKEEGSSKPTPGPSQMWGRLRSFLPQFAAWQRRADCQCFKRQEEEA